jgi:hypothetical protein
VLFRSCYEIINDNKKEIINKNFIKNHLANFFSILDKENFSGIANCGIIDFESNKLIIVNHSSMYFYDNNCEILYEVKNYQIDSVKLLYHENSKKKIDYNKTYKKMLKLIRNNYDLLELYLLKIEIDSLNYAINQQRYNSKVEELILEVRNIQEYYNYKVNLCIDSKDRDYQYFRNNRDNRFFSIIFNDSWLFSFAKKMISFVELELYFYKAKPTILSLLFTKLANAFIIPLIDLTLGINEFFAFDQFYEKKLEIDDQRFKLSEIINNYQELNNQLKIQKKNSFFSLCSNAIEFTFSYSFELAHFLLAEIFKIILKSNFLFKKIISFA